MNRIYNILIDWAILSLIVLMILILGGCQTTYAIKVCHQDTNVCSEVMVRSYREFEQPTIHYSRTDETVTFKFGAASATTGVSPIEQAFADVLRQGGTIGAALITPPGVQ